MLNTSQLLLDILYFERYYEFPNVSRQTFQRLSQHEIIW